MEGAEDQRGRAQSQWKVRQSLTILQHLADRRSPRITVSMLNDLVRGNGGGSFPRKKTRNNDDVTKGSIDINTVAEGKVTLKKEVSPSVSLSVDRGLTTG